MLTGPRVRRWNTIFAMPLALWAALPAVQWCPVGWDHVCALDLLRCSAIPGASADCMRSATPKCVAVPDPENCSVAQSGGCGGMESCPFARGRATCTPPPAVSPSGLTSRDPGVACATPEPVARAHAAAPATSSRAYCLSGPNGGLALGAHHVQLERAPWVVAVLAVVAVEADPGLATPLGEWTEERPPPETPVALPPARAPPSPRG